MNKIKSEWLSANNATRTSKFTITGVSNGTETDWLTLIPSYGLLHGDTISTRAYARNAALSVVDATNVADGNYVVTSNDRFLLLGDITADRTVTVPDGTVVNQRLEVDCTNTTGFSWLISGNVVYYDGTAIPSFSPAYYRFYWNGTKWKQIQ
ncbi:hypothetical protein FPE01S_02_09100 [Flavihumibacter petaseus NBRC 106054]|uniref:Uncharacterized protein n=2 Tax=Flavihumibacter TaxID=1004301 RepID=A0A0E9N1S3_9BACT|nr:hypothetical protein FPE01S_02_09100 [Flavihumibacter petaseus NBRC 106054]